jgi:very-short-patch-repair endonuclease
MERRAAGEMKGYSSTGLTRAKDLRKRDTDAERRIWGLLRNRSLHQFKFRRQHPIGAYIVDFVCLEKRLVIEVDGGQHAEQSLYDSKRSADLEIAGYRVLRFWDNDVLTQTDSVMQVIYRELGCPSP